MITGGKKSMKEGERMKRKQDGKKERKDEMQEGKRGKERRMVRKSCEDRKCEKSSKVANEGRT